MIMWEQKIIIKISGEHGNNLNSNESELQQNINYNFGAY